MPVATRTRPSRQRLSNGEHGGWLRESALRLLIPLRQKRLVAHVESYSGPPRIIHYERRSVPGPFLRRQYVRLYDTTSAPKPTFLFESTFNLVPFSKLYVFQYSCISNASSNESLQVIDES